MAVDGSGNVVVTGSSWNVYQSDFDYYSLDYYTAKYSAATGALLWEKRYDGPLSQYDSAQAVVVDKSGDVVVTGSSGSGYSDISGFLYDFYTAKYAAADGALIWEKRYNHLANGNDRANAVAVDGRGNVIVTGSSENRIGNGKTRSDYYTAKYASADGALLWEQYYNSPVNGYDEATALAVDASGHVVVTGISYNGTNTDFYTVKYAAMDGVPLWEKCYNGTANDDDRPNAVAVDAGGNVVVTGVSHNGSTADYYTAKYAAADGALLWEKHANGGGQSVAVDGSDNVVVTGVSHNETNVDYYTAKYAAADGGLLWERRYNGPANEHDGVLTSRGLALGVNGMVAVTGSSGGDYATVVYRETLPPVSLALMPTGLRLYLTGVPGRSYNIERARGITGPWTRIHTQIAPIGGVFEYMDAPPPAGQVFYRTVEP